MKKPLLKKIEFYAVICGLVLFFGWANSGLAQDSTEEDRRAQQYYHVGQIYYEQGLYDQAEQEFQKALKTRGSVPMTNVMTTQAQIQENKAAEGPSLIGISKEQIDLAEAKKTEESKEPSMAPPPITTQTSSAGSGSTKPIIALRSTSEYTVGAGDVLYVSVWDNPDLTQEVIVRPDGRISFPLVHEVEAIGRTIPELNKILTDKLRDYIRYPDVAVSLRRMGGQKVVVLGEVVYPGVYMVEARKTVSEAIAAAQGFTKDAVISSIIVIQGGLQNPKARKISLSGYLGGKDWKASQDLVLNSGDIVYVPRKIISNYNYCVMQILGPFGSGTNSFNTTKHYFH